MDNTFNLLKALCEALGFEVEDNPYGFQDLNGRKFPAGIDYRLKKKPKQSKSRTVEYSEEFEQVWDLYPKRAGSNPKTKAYEQWKARQIDNKTDYDSVKEMMLEGTKRYSAYCKATKKEGTELVMQAVRFFGREKEYLNDWTIPKEITKLRLPKEDEKLESFARDNGLTSPAPKGMKTYNDYRKLLLREIERIT